MSILNGPRINFFGGIEVDVSVPNNEASYPINGNKEAIFDPKTSTLTDVAYQQNLTDEQIIDMFRAPKDDYFTYGGWNIYGQHSVVTTHVTTRSGGEPGKVSTGSPLAGFPMYLLGSANPDTGETGVSSPVMVDLNPLGSLYSQIVLGGLLVGDPDKPLLHLQGNKMPGNMGLFKKILNGEPDSPGSSKFAGSWQATFDASEVVAIGQSGNEAADRAIKDFVDTQGMQGIVVNFSFFEMCPKMTTAELRASYNRNQNERNPSVGRVIGTIGIAFKGETDEYPDGRELTAASGPVDVPAYACLNKPSTGNALLSIEMRLALTQKNFRTERDGYTADTLEAAIDAGELALQAGDQTITSIAPQYSDYYLYGGILDTAIAADQVTPIEQHPLSITGKADSASKVAALKETPYRLYSSQKDVYMGEKGGDSQSIELVVRYLGQPLTETVEIAVARVNTDELNNERYLDLPQAPIPVKAQQPSTTFTLTNKTGSEAEAGWEQVQFSHGEATFVVNTRKFKHTDFGIAKGASVTWDQVYEHNLRYHYLNFLGMSTVFPLNLAETINQHRDAIKKRTSSQYWPTTLYMPIVRSMSPSQIRLLNAYMFNQPWDPNAAI